MMFHEHSLRRWRQRTIPTRPIRRNDAYTVAREITREASKSFYLSTLLLPRPKRRAIQALYAFLRTTDNIVDDGGAGATLAALESWRSRSRRPAERAGSPGAARLGRYARTLRRAAIAGRRVDRRRGDGPDDHALRDLRRAGTLLLLRRLDRRADEYVHHRLRRGSPRDRWPRRRRTRPGSGWRCN